VIVYSTSGASLKLLTVTASLDFFLAYVRTLDDCVETSHLDQEKNSRLAVRSFKLSQEGRHALVPTHGRSRDVTMTSSSYGEVKHMLKRYMVAWLSSNGVAWLR